ncbi:hypothetical protein [Kineosporia sp. R_H_3]|uniref:hypothetical protein n=1 Tax=Kineosporia sp. R_H_3 TaxID=1961848 RepID=UPI000B4B2171|nr:hypothetical protein [Kineosporia sp. R_H_3]
MTEQHSIDSSTFDVDAWLEAAAPPQRSVTVYGRADLVAQLEDLVAERDAAQLRASTVPVQRGPIDPRLGGVVAETEDDRDIAFLDDRISDIRAALEGSRLVLHLRALLNEERGELLKKHRASEDDDLTPEGARAYEHDAIALALVSPPMTTAQTARLHTRIGEAQWAAIGRTLERASSETIDVPLSRLG